MRSLKTLTLTLFLIGALPTFGAAYIKFDGVDGEVTAADHKHWINLVSVQTVGGRPRNSKLEMGRVLITSYSFPSQIDALCKSGRPLGNVLLDVDGKRHVLRNARFAECPIVRGGIATAVLEFGGGVFVAAGDVNGDGGEDILIGGITTYGHVKQEFGGTSSSIQRGNATIAGLGRTPLAMDIRRASLSGNVATIALKAGTVTEALRKSIMEATAKGTVFPVFVIESAGQKWSFTKAMFSSANYSQAQDTVFSFQFETMNGSAAAFAALGN